jgi:aldehyde:ferredoxin oxidoreductase
MPGGYMGKILWVDLSSQKFHEEEISEDIYKRFLAGYGLGAKIIFDRQKPKVDALSEDAILGFVSGLLTGTGALFVGRFMVVGKSPLTGGWGDSNSGGYFAPEIKKAGYDGIFFTGKASKPVYLLIKDNKIELKDASHLWGKDAVETEEIIRRENGEQRLQVACIGKAGEKLSLISGIVTDRGRLAGRSGLGAVMGSKKLKAIAIKGNKSIPVYSREEMLKLNKKFLNSFQKTEFLAKSAILGKFLKVMGKALRALPVQMRMDPVAWRNILKRYGTSGITAMSAETGDAPVKNWKGSGYFDFPISSKSPKISDEEVIKYQVKRYACYACPLGCGGIYKVKDGPYPIEESHKPEYETLTSFGTLTLTDDIHTLAKINDIVNRAGIDSISTGSVVAFAMECFENGIITEKDTGGLKLTWGNGEAALKLTEKIINRDGIGDILADGVKRAAERLGKGAEKFAIHAGGEEIPMHDPRFDPGFGIGYSSEPTPGRHTVTSLTYAELCNLHQKFSSAKSISMFYAKSRKYEPEGKGKITSIVTKYYNAANGCGFCIFGLQVGANIPAFEWVNASTGWDYSNDDYLVTGERIWTIRQAFNVREGIHPKQLLMHPRAQGNPPLEKGPLAGVTLDMHTMLTEFFREFGWDYDKGLPDIERLDDLGLDEVKKALYGR